MPAAEPGAAMPGATVPLWLWVCGLVLLVIDVGSVLHLLADLEKLTYRDALAFSSLSVVCTMAALVILQVLADTWLSGASITEGQACDYCGGKNTRVICRDCKLVQWKSLKAGGSGTFWAGLMAAYRWQISTAILSFVVVSAISLGAWVNDHAKRDADQRIEQARTERQTQLTSVLKTAEAGAAFRGALLMIEATCVNPRSPECASHFTAFRENYYRYSLQAPAVLYAFMQICESLKDNQAGPGATGSAGAQAAAGTKGWAEEGAVRQSRKLMCDLAGRMKYESMLDELNKDFRRYINLVAACSPADVACTLRRRALAAVLYENGRIAQCAITEVAYEAMFYEKPKPFRTYQRCDDPKWLTEAPTAGPGDLDWASWPALRDDTVTTRGSSPIPGVRAVDAVSLGLTGAAVIPRSQAPSR